MNPVSQIVLPSGQHSGITDILHAARQSFRPAIVILRLKFMDNRLQVVYQVGKAMHRLSNLGHSENIASASEKSVFDAESS